MNRVYINIEKKYEYMLNHINTMLNLLYKIQIQYTFF